MTPREAAEKITRDYREYLIKGTKLDLNKMIEDTIESFLSRPTVIPCPDHPKYKGLRKPRLDCEGCWRYYIAKKDNK